jgi:hypothetical protein
MTLLTLQVPTRTNARPRSHNACGSGVLDRARILVCTECYSPSAVITPAVLTVMCSCKRQNLRLSLSIYDKDHFRGGSWPEREAADTAFTLGRGLRYEMPLTHGPVHEFKYEYA